MNQQRGFAAPEGEDATLTCNPFRLMEGLVWLVVCKLRQEKLLAEHGSARAEMLVNARP